MKKRFKIVFYQILILFVFLTLWQISVGGSKILGFLYGFSYKNFKCLSERYS